MPKVSVIIPVYNVEKYLKKCLDSVINHTLTDIEIICINDGSTDGSAEILQQYAQKDERVRIINKANSGYGDSMNKGLDAAQGEYIGFVESDDYIKPDMYETLYKVAKDNDIEVLKSDFYSFVGDGELYHNKLDKTDKYYNRIIDISEDFTPFRFHMYTWSGIYNREFLNKHNIRHNTTPGASYQDNGFWFQTFIYSKRLYFYNKPFYCYRRDNENSSVNNEKKVYTMKYEYDFIQGLLEKSPELYRKYIGVCLQRRFSSYVVTYNRIAKRFKKTFYNRMVEEFRGYEKQGLIDYDVFSKREAKQLQNILKHPKIFYLFNNRQISGFRAHEYIFALKNEMINGTVYKTVVILGLKLRFKRNKKQ